MNRVGNFHENDTLTGWSEGPAPAVLSQPPPYVLGGAPPPPETEASALSPRRTPEQITSLRLTPTPTALWKRNRRRWRQGKQECREGRHGTRVGVLGGVYRTLASRAGSPLDRETQRRRHRQTALFPHTLEEGTRNVLEPKADRGQ